MALLEGRATLYLSRLVIENFRCFGQGDETFELALNPGLTALVGENEAGKTAIIDAIRIALGTTDQEWYMIEDDDFQHRNTSLEIRIQCKFANLSPEQQVAFVEYLTFESADEDNELVPVLYVNWTARVMGPVRRGRRYRRVEVRSGAQNDGPVIIQEVRELLRTTYLRPLRDAEQALSPGRGSRLSQILQHAEPITSSGEPYDPDAGVDPSELNVLGIAQLTNRLLKEQQGIAQVRADVDRNLEAFSLHGDDLRSTVNVVGADADDAIQLRKLLEKLELGLEAAGRTGLGANNLLFMASELLLLANDDHGLKLLLLEEPEAHLHAQRQLRAMSFLQEQAEEKGIQVIITTHSPNLASAIDLERLVIIRDKQAFPLAKEATCLEVSDYRFLQRFLDVTKANLFFARAVMIVEGDSEAILIPAIAQLLDRDFTEYGVSIVNVGGVGLHRYARIFQRAAGPELTIPVANVVDLDVMPDCAPLKLGLVKEEQDWPGTGGRRWRAKRDIGGPTELEERRAEIEDKHSGQFVKTFVSDEWTFEYALALGARRGGDDRAPGLVEDVFMAAFLAYRDDAINSGRRTCRDVLTEARAQFAVIDENARAHDNCNRAEDLAASVYAFIIQKQVSKPTVAQYLSERLERKHSKGELTATDLRNQLTQYLIDAIDYVTVGVRPMNDEDV